MPKSTVSNNSKSPDCPVLDGSARTEFRAVASAANTFSHATLEWLQRKDAARQATWLRRAIGLSRELFQPWTIETLFLIGIVKIVRFSELERALEVSSRTLSNRLKVLREANLIERIVHDEQPVRIEYQTTKEGRKVAALAAPLIAYLGTEAFMRMEKV